MEWNGIDYSDSMNRRLKDKRGNINRVRDQSRDCQITHPYPRLRIPTTLARL